MNSILIISSIILIFFIPPICYFRFGWFKFFYHDIMGWHVPVRTLLFNGVSFKSKCKHCGKDIMMDSQGNWY